MNKIQKTEYIKRFKEYMREINLSKANAQEFYNKAGITTPNGNLKKNYKPIQK